MIILDQKLLLAVINDCDLEARRSGCDCENLIMLRNRLDRCYNYAAADLTRCENNFVNPLSKRMCSMRNVLPSVCVMQYNNK